MIQNNFVMDKLRVLTGILYSQIKTAVFEIKDVEIAPCGYDEIVTPPKSGWQPFDTGDRIGGVDKHFWFSVKLRTPEAVPHNKFWFELKTGTEGQGNALRPQCMVFLNGTNAQAFDTNHTKVLLEADTDYDIRIHLYVGMKPGKIEFLPSLIMTDDRIEKAYYDFYVPYSACKLYPKDSENFAKVTSVLEQAANIIYLNDGLCDRYFESLEKATDYLQTEFYDKMCGDSTAIVNCIGHTHIDVAWLWTLEQTREKAQRSFSTVLKLMDEYPEYKFMSSQPKLYRYVKQTNPEMYDKIKQRVAEGRWEVEGAMWLEADCNLISGESMVRQILQGKKFMKDEFGVESKVLWLPDVFGYSAAMPQILKKCGVDNFVTSKISWNETNRMPVDTFIWQGIDGTEIKTDFLTCHDHTKPEGYNTYVGTISPDMVLGTWEAYRQKEYNNETLITFGYGDGGGGPTREMLEVQRRTAYGLPGLPKTRIITATEHLKHVWDNMEEQIPKLLRTPKWVGELYLEFHRGTYTSQAKNKRNNRKCELLLQKAETLSAISMLCGGDYPDKRLYDEWEVVLLHQFHDIIPGSSIKEVYDESDIAYAGVFKTASDIVDDKLKFIADRVDAKDGVLVYNPLGFTANGTTIADGKTVEVENIPAFGWKVIESPKPSCNVIVTGNTAENKYYRLTLDESGRISSLYDKKADREVFREGSFGNELQIFEDYPRKYDAWEITNYYKQKMEVLDGKADITPVFDGDRAGFKICKKYLKSTICQVLWLYTSSRRIDIENEIDWHEKHQLLKAAFPVDVHALKATYEIQFGHIERPSVENTLWDAAKFEVCGHKWVDISENGYGLSLLNDCKYGFNTEENTLKMTLLKCATYPDPEADQGMHYFTYSLLPHEGDFREADTVREAYMLNQPLQSVAIAPHTETSLPAGYSLINCDCKNIVVETVKKAEDNDDLIVRLYEAFDSRCNATLKFGFDVKRVFVCDMLENIQSEIEVLDNAVNLPIKNFEIVTLRIKKGL